jgi:hypothetical protein
MTNYASLMSDAVLCNQINKSHGVRRGYTPSIWAWLHVRLSRR